MDKVWIVMKSVFNGCDCFEWVCSVHSSEDGAMWKEISLTEENTDEYISYYVRVEDVIND